MSCRSTHYDINTSHQLGSGRPHDRRARPRRGKPTLVSVDLCRQDLMRQGSCFESVHIEYTEKLAW
jgi:hypothetical protein